MKKLWQELKSGIKRGINWNKYHSEATPQNVLNPYLDCLIDPSFQRVNRLFVLGFNVKDSRIGHSRCYLPTPKIEE